MRRLFDAVWTFVIFSPDRPPSQPQPRKCWGYAEGIARCSMLPTLSRVSCSLKPRGKRETFVQRKPPSRSEPRQPRLYHTPSGWEKVSGGGPDWPSRSGLLHEIADKRQRTRMRPRCGSTERVLWHDLVHGRGSVAAHCARDWGRDEARTARLDHASF